MGWRGESQRHVMSSRGVKTKNTRQSLEPLLKKGKNVKRGDIVEFYDWRDRNYKKAKVTGHTTYDDYMETMTVPIKDINEEWEHYLVWDEENKRWESGDI